MKALTKRNKVHISLIITIAMIIQMLNITFVSFTVKAATDSSITSIAATNDVIKDKFENQPGGTNTWYLAGTFTGWNNTSMPFAHLVGEFYACSIVLDAGTHEFKITKNGTWDGYSDNGNNFKLTLNETTKVNIYINDEIGEARINVAGVESLPQYTKTLTDDKWPRLVGTIQSVFDENEWDPSAAKQYFVDYYFDNSVYKLQRHIPAGQYEAKVVFGANWEGENYGDENGNNVKLVTLDSSDITFSIDYSAQSKCLTHDYKPAEGSFDGMIKGDKIKFDSQSITYKNPFGAIPDGKQDLTLRIAAEKDDVQYAKVELLDEEELAKSYDMKKITTFDDLDYFETVISAEDFLGIGVWGYKFILIDGSTKVEYGDDGIRGGTGKASDDGAIPFDLTVYDADFHTPDWMKNAIVYQIFPDRFFDGNEENNRAKTVDGYRGDLNEETPDEAINAYPLQYFDSGVESDPTPNQVWGEWSDIPEMPERCNPENAPYFPDSTTDGISTNEFYGGDIQGVMAKLNYLESIGVTAIYFNPIAWAASNHKYDATDYNHLDPMFGEPVYNMPGDPTSGLDCDATRTASDKVFISFANEAKKRGIHIITDGVFNHVGDDSIYFDKYEKYPEIGAYEYWSQVYDHVNNDNMTLEEAEQTIINKYTSEINPATGLNYRYPNDFEFTTWFTIYNEKVLTDDNVYIYKYDSWWGYDSLPTIDAINPVDGDGDAIEGKNEWNVESYRNSVIGYDLSHMTEEEQQEAMINTASQVWNYMGASGWRLDVAPDVSTGTWEKFREAVKSEEGLMNALNEPIDEPVILGEEWGVATKYLLGNEFDSVMNYRFRSALQSFLTGGSAQTMNAALESIREDYPKEAWLAMLNLVGSHDTTRNITLMDHPEYAENKLTIAEAATDKAKKLQELTAIFQMGYPGAPTVYYGDEVGLEGTKDPDSRRTFPWERINETNGEFSGVGQYEELFNVYQKAADIRNNNEVFRTGDIKLAYADGNIIAYARKNSTSAGFVVINKGEEAATINADVSGFIPNGVVLCDKLYGNVESTVTDGKFTLTIPALTGFLMVNEGELTEVPVAENVTAVGNNGFVSVAWEEVEGAEGYNIYRAPIEGGDLTLLASNFTELTFKDTSVTNGKKYYYGVTALIGNSESILSDMASATPAYPIDSVIISTQIEDMTIGVGKCTTGPSVTIKVSGLTDNDEYKGLEAPNMIARLVYYVEGTDKSNAMDTKLRYKEDLEDGSKVYSTTFEPAEAGVYHYYAKVSTDNGESFTESDEVTFNAYPDKNDTSPPSEPVLADIEVESNMVNLSWTSEGTDISGFDVLRKKSTDNEFVKIASLSKTVTSYIDYSVSNDTEYIYKIAAFDQAYNRSYSEEKSVTPKLVLVDVTLRLHLPSYTPVEDDIYIAGDFNGWNSSGNVLTIPSGATNRDIVEYTFKMMAGKSIQYKYTRGTWETEAFTSHTRVENDTQDYGNWAYSSTDTNMQLTISNQGGNKMLIDDYVLRWVDMPMMISMPRISFGDDIEFETEDDSYTLKAVVPYGVEFTINDKPIADGGMDEYGNVYIEDIPLVKGENEFVLHIEPTEETLNQPWYTDKGRASQATETITMKITAPNAPSASTGSNNHNHSSASSSNAITVNPTPDANGKVVISLGSGVDTVLIPAKSEAIDKKNTFEIGNSGFKVVIGGELLEALKALLPEADLVGAHISFSAVLADDSKIHSLTDKAKEKEKAEVKTAGDVYEFNLSIIDKNGKEYKLNSFIKPVLLSLNVDDTSDKKLVGIYNITDDGTMEYEGSDISGNQISAGLIHLSVYGVFEYNKSFKDVDEKYWAYSVIKEMAAKQIVEGINDIEFAPHKPVTRGEFTAMIVRALKLETESSISFKDVDKASWYYKPIAAAYEARIISGRSDDLFAPNDLITREEMAKIIMKAYELKAGKKIVPCNDKIFSDDSNISNWAKPFVNSAAEVGLVKGRDKMEFDPQGKTTRAESAQAIYNLLKNID